MRRAADQHEPSIIMRSRSLFTPLHGYQAIMKMCVVPFLPVSLPILAYGPHCVTRFSSVVGETSAQNGLRLTERWRASDLICSSSRRGLDRRICKKTTRQTSTDSNLTCSVPCTTLPSESVVLSWLGKNKAATKTRPAKEHTDRERKI